MKKDVMEYKGYIGSIRFDAEDEMFYGKIEAINDLILFQGESVKELKTAFHEAVDDYLETCEKMGRTPNKTFKGSFNVRVGEDLHVKAYSEALRRGVSLNQLITEALEHELTHA